MSATGHARLDGPPAFAVRLPLMFSVAPLLAEVDALGSAPWRVHFNTGYHDGGWSGVVLQSTNRDERSLFAPTVGSVGDSVRPTPLAGICPAIMHVIASFQCEVKAARILRLAAGATIREHTDADLVWTDGEARLHIPLRTHANVAFYVADHRVSMQAGECWYLDLSRPHRVQNRSTCERVHLVLDCAVNEWLADQVERGSALDGAPTPADDQAATPVQAFREAVFAEQHLLDELQRCIEPHELMLRAVALGAARGLHFSVEDVRAEMDRARREWAAAWTV